MAVNLTPGAISKIMTGKETVREPVLQVIAIKCLDTRTKVKSNGVVEKKAWYSIVLSDGSVCIDGFINIFDEKISEMIRSNKLQKGSLVQLTNFSSITSNLRSYISVDDLNVIRRNGIILGDPKPFPGVLDRSKPTIIDHDHSESEDTNEDVDNSHLAKEPSATTQKCSSHSLNQSKKRKRRSSNDNISKAVEDVSKMTKLTMEKIKTVDVGFKRLETLEEDVSKMTKMMEKNKDDVGACFKKLETLEEDVSKMTKMMEKNKEDDVGFKKLETLEEDVSRMTIMMMEKNKEDVVGFKKLETLEEDVSKMTKMVEKNKEDDIGACFKKLETLEENVSKLTRMMMEKNKDDDMGACIEKLDKIGWVAQDPMYDTALLLFGQSADYRKLWLHLKPESCGNWVKNAGSMFGLLD